jgi:hypothetical protein
LIEILEPDAGMNADQRKAPLREMFRMVAEYSDPLENSRQSILAAIREDDRRSCIIINLFLWGYLIHFGSGLIKIRIM